ncbi:MAG: MerR family transcriptional regulator [Aeromicrobium sp.]
MTSTMSIGDFSRATRLSAKALRHYHRVGLLEPAIVDPVTGYRFYGVEQISDAQLIRHFRSLEMPIDLVAQVLRADRPDDRDELISAHLRHMEQRLAETRDAVTALRGLLATDRPPSVVVRREVDATPALVVRARIELADLGTWFTAAQAELREAATAPGVIATGPLGGLWSTELIRDEAGDAALFLPIDPDGETSRVGQARFEILPPVLLAVATHTGPDATVGQVYAELGEHVARHETGIDGPVRETYLAGTPGGHGVTEIGWPVAP